MREVQGIPRYRTDELELMPTIAQGQTHDLKFEDGRTRLWLARTGIADGEPFRHTVSVERLSRDGYSWLAFYDYDGDHPMTRTTQSDLRAMS